MAFIQYAAGRRYDPSTGQAQWMDARGQWQDAGYVMYDPRSGQLYNPQQPRSTQVFQQPSSSVQPTSEILRQIYMAQQMGAGSPAAPAQGGGSAAAPSGMNPSYWSLGAPAGPVGPAGTYGAYGAAAQGIPSGGNTQSMAANQASQIPTGVWGSASPADVAEWQKWYGQNQGKTIIVNGQAKTIGQDISANDLWNSFRGNQVGFGPAPGPQAPPPNAGYTGGPTVQPETRALQQIAQIDPTSEALRTALGQSYLTGLSNIPQAPTPGAMPTFNLDLSKGAAAPNQADVQSYLDLYKNLDPTGYAARAAMAGNMSSYLQQAQAQAALGSQLDPGTIREVEQGVRSAQAARGNVYGTPQLVAETMARGSAGEQRLQQRQQALGAALGAQQSYLTSGAGLGDVANTLYNQGYGRYLQGYGAQVGAQNQAWNQQLAAWQAQQGARQTAQANALSYLGSGQTPYQMGAGYYDRASAAAAAAGQGGPQYNPQALGPGYTGTAQQYPQYGLDMSQLAGNWYNSLGTYGGYGVTQPNRTGAALGGAAAGALSGAASGAALGSAVPGIGTAVGAIGGGLLGGLGGGGASYFR